MVLRRGRGAAGGGGGFSSSASTVARSYDAAGTDAERDEIDDVIDPDDYGNRVARTAPQAPVTGDQVRANPRLRLNEVAQAGSSAYAKEYRLELLGRLLMRGTPLDQIARQLQVSISTVEKDRAELNKRLRESARNLNVDEMIGRGNSFYDEAQAMALRIASANDTPVPMRLAGVRTALAANADRTRFLNSAGVFDALRFRRTETGDDMSDVQLLMMRTGEMLAAFAEGEKAAPAPRPSVVRRRRSSKGEGFGPLTFRDDGGTSSDNEVEII